MRNQPSKKSKMQNVNHVNLSNLQYATMYIEDMPGKCYPAWIQCIWPWSLITVLILPDCGWSVALHRTTVGAWLYYTELGKLCCNLSKERSPYKQLIWLPACWWNLSQSQGWLTSQPTAVQPWVCSARECRGTVKTRTVLIHGTPPASPYTATDFQGNQPPG